MGLEKNKDFSELLGIVVKAAAVFSAIGIFAGTVLFTEARSDINKLKEGSSEKAQRIAVLETWAKSSDYRQQRIESKIDEILKIAKQ